MTKLRVLLWLFLCFVLVGNGANARMITAIAPVSSCSQEYDCDNYTLKEGETCFRDVKFARGRNSAIYKNKWLVRTTTHVYTVKARAGQRMTVSLRSLEKNASFNVSEVDGTAEKEIGSQSESDGTVRPITRRPVTWNGRLPETGEYHIEVGANRGNATYTLTVIIR